VLGFSLLQLHGAPWHYSLIFVEASLLRPVDRLAISLCCGNLQKAIWWLTARHQSPPP
jgi:hypothetical protein